MLLFTLVFNISRAVILFLLYAGITDRVAGEGADEFFDSDSGAREPLDAVYAVNCGGSSHTDVNGIRYQRDNIDEGTSSDYGLRYNIHGVPPADQILYQIERYHDTTFGYDIPVVDDGDYVLVLQFAEVYFTRAGLKVFDVLLNHEHIVVDNLDIFDRSGGRAIGLQESIPFSIRNGIVKVNDEESRLVGPLRIDFVKTTQDNPKCNAFYIARNKPSSIPKLPKVASQQQRGNSESAFHLQKESNSKASQSPSASVARETLASGPPLENPYEQDKMQLLPIWLALLLAPGLGYVVWRM